MGRTLREKISLVYLSLVVLIAIVGTMSVFNLYRLGGAIDGLMTNNYKSIDAAANMSEAIERQDSAVLIYISVDRQRGLDMFQENNNTFLKWYNIEDTNITESGERELVNGIYTNYNKYVKLFSQLQDIKTKDGEDKAFQFYTNALTPQFQKVKDSLKELSDINELAMFSSKNKATNSSKQYTLLILILTVFATITGFLVSRLFTERFLRPIYKLADTMKKIKDGDLSARAEVTTHDEVGLLAVEMNNLNDTLIQYKQSTLGQLMSEKNKSVAIVKSINDPLIVLDKNYKIQLINNACEVFFGISEEKVTKKHFLEAIRNGELFDFISSNLQNEGPTREKILCLNSNGVENYFNVSVMEIKSDDYDDFALIVVLQDVTQLKNLDKMRTDFIATISHEFKTPLTSIIMGTEMLRGGIIGSLTEDQKEILTAIKEDSDRLSTLVNDLLELTKIESGKAIYKYEACHIDGILAASIRQFSNQAQTREIDLVLECADDLPKVRADYEKITWVVNNLLSNALKYTNAGDEILVSAQVENGKMNISVKDSGAGIPEEYINRIFDKFVQVKDGDVEARGTGLGLSVVRDIIKAHGGDIECKSKLDSGSCFSFTLELA